MFTQIFRERSLKFSENAHRKYQDVGAPACSGLVSNTLNLDHRYKFENSEHTLDLRPDYWESLGIGEVV